MAVPSSRTELKDYCLRRLGYPVVDINVDDEQVEDRIDDALKYYQDYHYDGTERIFLKHQITAEDKSNEYITIPEAVIGVVRVFDIGDAIQSSTLFNIRYQIHLNDIFDLGNMGNLSNYTMIQSYLTTLDMMLNGAEQVRFSRHMNRLHIDTDWGSDLKENDYIIVDAFQIIDPEQYSDVYNDMFLKRYVTALIKMQWGSNLSKFEGMQLPGGVTINAQRIMDEAREEIMKIEEEMQLKYEMPPMFYMG